MLLSLCQNAKPPWIIYVIVALVRMMCSTGKQFVFLQSDKSFSVSSLSFEKSNLKFTRDYLFKFF